MAKETKIGLALCVLLIGAFAFVVYSKMNKKSKFEEGEVVATTDSASVDAPPPFGDDLHQDFGGEPGHDHDHDHDHGHDHAHDHGDAFNDDRHATIDNFDIPDRKRKDKSQNTQPAPEPWQSAGQQTPHDHSQHQQTAGKNDPFAQASHQHTHNDRDRGHRHGREEEPFGFEQDAPKPENPPVKEDKKSWNLADFLGGKKKDTTTVPAPEPEQHASFEDTEESPFGFGPEENNRPQQPAQQSADGFNPFASTEQAETAEREKIQQSGARTFVEDPNKGHNHDHKHGIDDEPEFDAWGSEGQNDVADTQNPPHSNLGSTTPDHAANGAFDAFDESPRPGQGHSRGPRDDFAGDEFGGTMPAPEPKSDPHQSPFGGHAGHNHQTHDDFSQPFGEGDAHQHHGHDHDHGNGNGNGNGNDGHLLPDNNDFAHDGERSEIYEAQRGDTFWDISKHHYGAGRYYKALASFNQHRIPDPRKMRPGMKVLIPRPEVLEARFPTLCPWRTAKPAGEPAHSHHKTGFFTNGDGQPRFRVGAEDTLTGIAQNHLGRASRWVQVFALNRDRIADPAKLKIGTILRLPADASRVQLVRRGHLHR